MLWFQNTFWSYRCIWSLSFLIDFWLNVILMLYWLFVCPNPSWLLLLMIRLLRLRLIFWFKLKKIKLYIFRFLCDPINIPTYERCTTVWFWNQFLWVLVFSVIHVCQVSKVLSETCWILDFNWFMFFLFTIDLLIKEKIYLNHLQFLVTKCLLILRPLSSFV